MARNDKNENFLGIFEHSAFSGIWDGVSRNAVCFAVCYYLERRAHAKILKSEMAGKLVTWTHKSTKSWNKRCFEKSLRNASNTSLRDSTIFERSNFSTRNVYKMSYIYECKRCVIIGEIHFLKVEYIHLTYWGKNPLFIQKFPWQKCEFCEKWEFKSVNFVEIGIFNIWIFG